MSLDLSVPRNMLYMTANSSGGILVALSMADKADVKIHKDPWPADIVAEFAREAKNPNPKGTKCSAEDCNKKATGLINLKPVCTLHFNLFKKGGDDGKKVIL